MSAILPNSSNLTANRQPRRAAGGVTVYELPTQVLANISKSRYLIAASPATIRPGRVIQYAPGITEGVYQNVSSINAFTAPLFAGVATYSHQDRFNRTPNYLGGTATNINIFEWQKGDFLQSIVEEEVYVETSLLVAPARNSIVSVLPDGRVGAAGSGVDLLATQAVYTGLLELNVEGANYAAIQIVNKLV
jgi:hypothetical protein